SSDASGIFLRFAHRANRPPCALPIPGQDSRAMWISRLQLFALSFVFTLLGYVAGTYLPQARQNVALRGRPAAAQSTLPSARTPTPRPDLRGEEKHRIDVFENASRSV